MGYIRRKKFEGMANLAAMGQAMQDGRQGRISAEAMILRMGGL